MLARCLKYPIPKLVNCFSFSSVYLEIVLVQGPVELEGLSRCRGHLCSRPWLAGMVDLFYLYYRLVADACADACAVALLCVLCDRVSRVSFLS